MALSLQANKLGLYTHAMGGFDSEKAFAVTGMNPEEYDVVCAIAIGAQGDASTLEQGPKEMEKPNGRKPISELVFEGMVK